jgi:hypothetical protein
MKIPIRIEPEFMGGFLDRHSADKELKRMDKPNLINCLGGKDVRLTFLIYCICYTVKEPGLWIRIRIGSGFSDFVDPDPYWESGSGSRGKKIKKFSRKNAL